MAKFEGICIGGPRHGDMMAGFKPRLKVPILMSVPDSYASYSAASLGDDRVAVDVEFCEFDTMHYSDGDLSYWRHESLPSRYHAMRFMMEDLSKRTRQEPTHGTD